MKEKSNKTIKVSLYFHTNDLKVVRNGKENIACWDVGKMALQSNAAKGIKVEKTIPFNSMVDIVPLIKELFKEHKILLVSDCGKPRTMNPRRKLG